MERGEKLSGTFKAKGGESWYLVAIQTSGVDTDADVIRRANPGLNEPLPPGAIVQIPVDSPSGEVETIPGLSIRVDNQEIGTYDDFELALAIDAISKGGFTVPNEPETRKIFVPLASPKVEIRYDGELLLSGRCESPQPDNSSESKTLNIEFYAGAGILERVHPPMSAFPLEWKDTALNQIADDLCRYHSVACDFQASAGARFKRVDIQPENVVLDFLAGLAAQRGPVITSSADGQLVFWTGTAPGSPVSRLVKGAAPCGEVSVQFDESKFYSSVTGKIPAHSKKGKGSSFTVNNPNAGELVRPFIFEAQDIDVGELETAVNTMAGRIFAVVVSVSVEIQSWTADDGSIYWPNQTVTLTSPEDYIPEEFEFLVSEVTLKRSSSARSAVLKLVLPGVYSGEIPEVMPWQ